MKTSRNAILILVLIGSTLLTWLMVHGLSEVQAGKLDPLADPGEKQGLQPLVVVSTRYDTSSPLHELLAARPDGYVSGPVEQAEQFPMLTLPKVQANDSTVQVKAPYPTESDQTTVQNMPAPIHNFDGIGKVQNVQPPDTQGDVGYDPDTNTKYYMQWVNLSLAIWDVTDPTDVVLLLGPASGNTLFTGFGGPCESTNSGDPIVLFDHLAQRWLASQFGLPNGKAGPYYQCVAVSQSANPTGEWHRYEYAWPVDKLNDYPKFGVWPDAYYLTVNQFVDTPSGSLQWAGAGVAAFERTEMLAGLPARLVFFDLYDINSQFGGMLPADLDGPSPPDGSPGYFIEWDDKDWQEDAADTLRLWEFEVDWTNTASSTFGLEGMPNAVIATSDVDSNMCDYQRECIAQPGTTNKLDAISDRLMYRAQYRNFGGHETLVSNHTVDSNGSDHAGIHWFELRKSGGSWSLHQDDVFAPDSENRWMASIAMDRAGNMALGYSVSSTSTFPSIRYAGRLFSDSLGSIPQGEVTLVAGGGSQTSFSNRWGDYSMMGVDPTDDCTFWYTQEYYETSGSSWKTRIGSFVFPDCITGLLGVQLSPDEAASGAAGETVTYTIHITNTGKLTDTFDLSFDGNAWPTTLSKASVMLAAKEATTFTLTVDILAAAAENDSDTVTVTARSRLQANTSDSAVLTTTSRSDQFYYFLPVFIYG